MKRESADTQLTPEAKERLFLVARHRLAGAATRLATDCDRLLHTLNDPSHAARRQAVGEAWLASRQIESLASGATPGGPFSTVDALELAIAAPRAHIVEIMTGLLTFVAVTVEDEMFLEDVRTIRDSATMLLAGRQSGVPTPTVVPDALHAGATRGSSEAREAIATLVLIVDDEPDLRQTLRRQLGRLGYRVLEAANGEEAFLTASSELPDLIITDLAMPVTNGFELLKRLKSDGRLRDIPVVIVSGSGDTDSLIRGIELGAEDHIEKPYELALLQARLRASLERKRMRESEVGYLRRVSHITAAAEAVERDAYTPGALAAVSREGDALGHLARVFDRMVSALRSREERLRRRVRRLRSEMESAGASGERDSARTVDSPFELGQVLADRFEVLGEIGRGGMGTVYRARDRQLNETIAIKALRPDLVASDPVIVERLKSEIRLARKLTHRNILRSHDLGESHGTYFITMEYIQGVTLSELLDRQGRLSVESVLAIGAQLADALDAAHSKGIIHRDIKPANLIVDEAGVLKIMDFGLARSLERETGNTRTGFVVGTPPYMAPEQLLGGKLDARTDLFAAGVVLYECLAGKTPYDAEDPTELLGLINRGVYQPLVSLVPDVPEPIETIISRLLRRRPDDRVQNARELADRLADMDEPAITS